jgi:hypothetical protein
LEPDSDKKKKFSKRKKIPKNLKALLLGVGLDSKDGHVRLTTGPNFQLLGGSAETHEAMQETAVKFNEELDRRGKQLAEIEPREFADIIHKVQPRRS